MTDRGARGARGVVIVTTALIFSLNACESGDGGSTSSDASVRDNPSTATAVVDGEEWLAYQWLDGQGDGIYLVRPDGSGQHQLVPDLPGSEIHPDWSPDGRRIAFVRFTPDDRSELWVVEADGSDPRRLTGCDLPCNSFGYPDWTSDGTAIIFGQDAHATAERPPTTFQVARYDVETGDVSVVLSRTDGMTVEQPRVSPDGEHIVYLRFRDVLDNTKGSAIFVCDLAGGRERRLTPWRLQAAYPDWSVEDVLVFHTYDLGTWQDTSHAANLYTVAPDGSGLTRLTDHDEGEARATQPRWNPDGTGIVFTEVIGSGWGTRTAAFLGLEHASSPLSGDPVVATHPTLRPVD